MLAIIGWALVGFIVPGLIVTLSGREGGANFVASLVSAIAFGLIAAQYYL